MRNIVSSFLYLRAIWQILAFEYYVVRKDFASLYWKVRDYPRSSVRPSLNLTDQICKAVDVVCIWHLKQVLCLQRSAATTCLLKRYGVSAQMVIGAQQTPFKAHAWVEVGGRVVNDKPYMTEIYAVLDRC